jgi:glycoside/pentoside/hexuronide:cation symporter, GPH family
MLLWMRIYDVGIPIVTSAIALLIIRNFDLTEEKANDIRRQLEKRRGKR